MFEFLKLDLKSSSIIKGLERLSRCLLIYFIVLRRIDIFEFYSISADALLTKCFVDKSSINRFSSYSDI